MECRNCHSKWDAGFGVYDNSKDTLARIMRSYSTERLLDRDFLINYALRVTTLREKIIFFVCSSGAAEILKSNMSASECERESAYRQAVKKIQDTYGTESGMAESILFEFTEAFGCKAVGQRNFRFGPYAWRVLDIRNGKALLLAEDIVERRAYHGEYQFITWEKCALRRYLNGEFLQNFSSVEQSRIAVAVNGNPDNQWYGTNGGSSTGDRVFLLGIDEVVEYFRDSGQLRYQAGKCYIDDRYNSGRVARDGSGEAAWWWLRSPGGSGNHAAYVVSDGSIFMVGSRVRSAVGGVRPALWLKL